MKFGGYTRVLILGVINLHTIVRVSLFNIYFSELCLSNSFFLALSSQFRVHYLKLETSRAGTFESDPHNNCLFILELRCILCCSYEWWTYIANNCNLYHLAASQSLFYKLFHHFATHHRNCQFQCLVQKTSSSHFVQILHSKKLNKYHKNCRIKPVRIQPNHVYTLTLLTNMDKPEKTPSYVPLKKTSIQQNHSARTHPKL